jgi:hypothetical protein
MFQETDFAEHIEKKYKMSMGPIIEEEVEEWDLNRVGPSTSMNTKGNHVSRKTYFQ